MTGPSQPPGRGAFITIEGPDGSGKTSQADRLGAHLRRAGVDVLVTREPGGTPLGERLRAVLLAHPDDDLPIDPITDALLFNGARHQHVAEVIRPALDAGTTVVCARFADSTLAYQGYGRGVPLDVLRRIEAVALDGVVPELTILLDLPVEMGLARKAPGDINRFEGRFDLDFHRRVRDGFLALAAREPGRWVVVDAALGHDEVASSVARAVDVRLGLGEPRAPSVRIHG